MDALTRVHWADIGAITGILTFTLGILVFLLQPRCKTWVWSVFEGDKKKLGLIVREILDPELMALKSATAATDEHADSLTFLRAALERQGEELRQLPKIAASMDEQVKSFRVMAETLGKIHEEVQEHGRRFERWDGFMEGQQGEWQGGTRRKKKRRATDPDPI